jgi:hypothetical protein
MPIPTLTCVVVSWAAGCEARGRSLSSSCPIRGLRVRGSAGRVNKLEPSLMLRHVDPREMDAGPGYRAWPQKSGKAAAGDVMLVVEHRWSRSTGGTQIRSYLVCVERGKPDRVQSADSVLWSADRKEGLTPWRARMPKKRKPVAERQQETETIGPFLQMAVSYNWPDTGPGARTRKRADMWQVGS